MDHDVFPLAGAHRDFVERGFESRVDGRLGRSVLAGNDEPLAKEESIGVLEAVVSRDLFFGYTVAASDLREGLAFLDNDPCGFGGLGCVGG